MQKQALSLPNRMADWSYLLVNSSIGLWLTVKDSFHNGAHTHKRADMHSTHTWHARAHTCSCTQAYTQIERWGHAECGAVKMTWSLFVTMVTMTGAGVPLWDGQAVEGAGRVAAAVQ